MRHQFPKLIIAVIFFHSTAIVLGQTNSAELSSPDQRIHLKFQIGSDDKKPEKAQQLYYSVSFNGKLLLKPSALSLSLNGYQPLGASVNIVNSVPEEVDQSYQLIAGKASTVRNRYNAAKLELEETVAPNRKLVIEMRAYNDAVAFRYVVPEQETTRDSFALKNENTEFHFNGDATTYAQVLPNYKSMYESEYLKLSVSAFSNQGGVKSNVLIGLPLLAEVPGAGWLAIAEADLQGYTSMYLTNPSGGWEGHAMQSLLSPRIDSSGMALIGKGAFHSAWRIVMIGDQPGRIVESNAVMNLSAPQAITDTKYVRAGKASWDWWNGSLDENGKSAYTTANMKYYVDFSAKSGLEYMLVDAGWSDGVVKDITKMNGKVDIPALVDYASTKNVKVWIWLYAKAVERQMEEAFALYEKWGVAGLKIDFIERDDQEGIDFYYKVAACAAKHHLMLDLHGSTKPFGLERTYPNIMNYEAVLGMEQSKGGTRDNPDNHAMLPFTRMLTGPMDFTPGGFNNVTRENFVARSNAPMVMGTRAHHTALYAIYQMQLGMVSDYPKAYDGQAEFDFIRKCPATWDEIKVLNGMPGEFITVARRSGNDWYVGAITNWQPRKLSIPLSFLKAGKYTAEIYADAPDAAINPKRTVISKITVDNKTVLRPSLVTGGGYCLRIVPKS
ncbi:MAG: glycoside hydrolase family 97 protein [Chitinophagaceae bacterium]